MSVSEGLGVSVMSDLAVSTDVKAGKLLSFPLPKEMNERKLYIVWHRDAVLSTLELKFIQFVKERTSDILLSE